jgi:hypothetical protein
MYFDEGRPLNQPRKLQSELSNFTRQKSHDALGNDTRNDNPVLTETPHRSAAALKATLALEAASDRLQELMQLFYLLSRDPAIPQDARYHVTLAQSEIALLTRVMQNIANDRGGELLGSGEIGR